MWGVPASAFNVVLGLFDESLTNKIPIEQAAIVWIDCDLYSSTVPVLKFIKPLLQDGSLVLFDDFGGTADESERRALREFLSDNPDLTFSPLQDVSYERSVISGGIEVNRAIEFGTCYKSMVED